MNKEYILEKLRENKKFFDEYGVIKIGLFGSYVNGEENEDSDIDILIDLKLENIYHNYCNTKYFLEDLFQKEIDLIQTTKYEPIYHTERARRNFENIKKNILESVIYA